MSKTLDEQFVKIVNDFCERNKTIKITRIGRNQHKKYEDSELDQECTPGYIAYKAGYTSRGRIDDVFKYGKSGLTFKVATRMIEVMKQIEPGFECELFGGKKGK